MQCSVGQLDSLPSFEIPTRHDAPESFDGWKRNEAHENHGRHYQLSARTCIQNVEGGGCALYPHNRAKLTKEVGLLAGQIPAFRWVL